MASAFLVMRPSPDTGFHTLIHRLVLVHRLVVRDPLLILVNLMICCFQ